MRTIIYVDGFNLYYGAVKDTSYKWLNISKLCQALLPKNKIEKIKYFTALVSARPGDPGKPTRQQMYLRALRTIPKLEIIYGHFLEHPVFMPLASSLPNNPQFVQVLKTEEKGSDVNIAAHLINDGYKELYQVAVLITNDSDLVGPIEIVRKELNLTVGILNPHRKPAYALKKAATFVKPIRKGVLAASQFPDKLTDGQGSFHKPPDW
ncbi:MAG: NYN domain-containing protein [Chloroflexi bacterium]|nr:NYN domain-containing protein [Chloroflexota bacterium]MBL7162086.1 NYN domain-containing protein [Anaerolineales bacterium]